LATKPIVTLFALCAVALTAGCKEDDPLRRIEPGAVRDGSVVAPDASRLRRMELVAMDFVTPERGFVATGDGRLLVTGDGGRSWRSVGARRRFVDLEFVTPRHGFTLTRVGTLLETNDGGHSWRFVRAFPTGGEGGPFVATVRFIDADRGWVVPFGGGIYRTRDGGRSWTGLRFSCGDDFLGGASPAGASTGYALCGGGPATIDQLKQLYVTYDGGDSWRLVARSHLCRGGRCRVHEDVPLTGHAAGLLFRSARDGLLIANRLGIYRTRDGGRHWRTTLFTDDAFFVAAVSWPAPRRLYALLGRGGLLASDDGGKHWEQRYPIGPGAPEGPVSFSSPTDGIGAAKGGFFRNPGAILATANGGKTWSVRTVIPGVTVMQLVRASRNVVWVVGLERLGVSRSRLVVLRTNDGGRRWKRRPTPRGVKAATLSAPSADVAFLATRDGRRLYRTTDGGTAWTPVVSDQNAFGAQFVTERIGLVLRQDGELAHTTDGGKTWKPVRIVGSFRVVGFAHFDDRHWWLAGLTCRRRSRRVIGKPSVCIGAKEILRTPDGGRSWDTIRLRTWPGSPDFDFVTPMVGYAGYGWYRYRTTDGGRTWKRL
jgi:photosystem II stability/assembly factor-like uncharacterized protein